MCGLLLHVEEIWALWFLCTANQAWKKKIQSSTWSFVSQSSIPCGILKVTRLSPLIKLCVYRIRCSVRSYPAWCLFGITEIIWSVFWRALSPVDLRLHFPHLQTTANTHLSQRVTQMPRTVRLIRLTHLFHFFTIKLRWRFSATLKK